ncbi:NgoMIV family type II restriction endonuclease [Streptomyces sp. NPDC048252]|uniref:NgoMIV family type II restriction endonuclease n=1 Tax=Streptomyces sp. NPDC048252 TaxID=3154612 RepID=UPI003435C679
MIRHQRGPLPHLVVVTAKPIPSRIASIAQGTRETDAGDHIRLQCPESRGSRRGQSSAKGRSRPDHRTEPSPLLWNTAANSVRLVTHHR